MRRFYLTLIVLVALLSLGVTTSCFVRSHPRHGHRASPVRKGHHHKHGKKPKKHKHNHLQQDGYEYENEYDSQDRESGLD